MLIPDARRGLFGGLFDHAAMLGASPPELADAVAEYRGLREGPDGWMMGRFVVPASRLEELAGLLVQTMSAGEPLWSLTVDFDGDPARDAALATSVHAMLDPAAPIDVVRVTPPSNHGDAIEAVIVAAGAVHRDVFPVVRILAEDDATIAERIALIGRRLLRPAGAALAEPTRPEAIAAHLESLAERGLAFTFDADAIPAVTDAETGRIGAMNLLAAIGLRGDGAAILAGTGASDASLGFGGLRWGHRKESITTRAPLLTITCADPGTAIDGLRAAGLDA